jgi:hypothetical protein
MQIDDRPAEQRCECSADPAIILAPVLPATMRILSSAETCPARRASDVLHNLCSRFFSGTDFSLIFAPCEGYDEPEILPSSTCAHRLIVTSYSD